MSTAEEIIGRADELARVDRFLDALADGPSALVVTGEAGIGKTTIWRHGLVAAGRRRYRTLRATPGELEVGLAYAAIADLLEGSLDAVLGQLPGPQAEALGYAVLYDGAGGPPPDQRAVSTAVLGALRALAVPEPVVLAIDDLQWLDQSSARALHFALRRLRSEPIGVLASLRLGSGEPALLRRSLAPECIDQIEVAPLDETSVDLVLRARLDTAFLRPTLRQLYKTSGGNPFFALELGRALLARGSPPTPGDPLPVPADLGKLVTDRIARLRRETRDVLLVTAALGAPTVSRIEDAVGSVERARTALGEAVEAGVLEVDQGRLRFSHPLLGSSVYSEASRDERRRVHRRLAGILSDPEERARQLALATELPDVEVAGLLVEAARRADARGAPEAAAALAEQALRLTPAEQIDEIVARTAEAADYHLAAGETRRSLTLLEEARLRLPAGPARARLTRRVAWAQSLTEGFPQVRGLMLQALGEAEDDLRLRAALERDIAFVSLNHGDLRTAEPHALEAVRLAESSGDGELLEDARLNAASIAFQRGRPTSDGHELHARSPAAQDDPGFMPDALHRGVLLKVGGDLGQARDVLAHVHASVLMRSEEGALGPVLFMLAELEAWAGRLGEAERLAAELTDVSLRARQPGLRTRALYAEGLLRAYQGRVDESRDAAERGLAIAEGLGDTLMSIRHHCALGFLELSLGSPGAACVPLTRAAELYEQGGYGEPGMFRFAADHIEALVAVDELTEAERRTTELEDHGRRLRRAWSIAAARRCRALLLAATGDRPGALETAHRAVSAAERLDQPLELVRALLVLGTAERRLKQKRLAREALERAVAVAARLPAPLWEQKARAELARIGGRARAPADLTPTEARVAELVATGRANKEVAAELYLSVRAVEANLTRIYRKLGVRSRAELAARLRSAAGP